MCMCNMVWTRIVGDVTTCSSVAQNEYRTLPLHKHDSARHASHNPHKRGDFWVTSDYVHAMTEHQNRRPASFVIGVAPED